MIKQGINKFKIKSFGNDTECESIDSVKSALLSKYSSEKPSHVSIVKATQSGFKLMFFVSVINGLVFDSNGKQALFDFSKLN